MIKHTVNNVSFSVGEYLLNAVIKDSDWKIITSVEKKIYSKIHGVPLAIPDLDKAVAQMVYIASPEDLVKLKISSKKANEFISMAKLMVKSNIAGVEGVDEQVAELLVVAGKIDSKEKLAQTSPEELTSILSDAIKTGKVKVPKSFRLTVDDSKRWIDSAKTLVDRSRILS